VAVNDLALLVAQALGRPDLTPQHKPERAGDLKHSFANLDRARALLGYQPIVAFETGLFHTLEWYRAVLARR
jgi:nucleoside-diphosphate-sugar epimerase